MITRLMNLLAIIVLASSLQVMHAAARTADPTVPAGTAASADTATDQKLAQVQRKVTDPRTKQQQRADRLRLKKQKRELRRERRRELSKTERRRLKKQRNELRRDRRRELSKSERRRLKKQRRIDKKRRDRKRRDRRRPNIYLDFGPYYDPFYDPYYDYPRTYGPGYYQPEYTRPRRISCNHAIRLLRNRGYRRIKATDCRGKVYGFTARRNGKRYRLRVSARNGTILSRRRY